MRKIIYLILSLIMILPVLVACNGNQTPPTTSGAPDITSEPDTTAEPSETSAPETTEPESTTEPEATTPADTTPPEEQYVRTTYKLLENLDKFKVMGRSTKTDNGVTMDWSASGIEFTADFSGYLEARIETSRDCNIAVYIDGVLVKEKLSINTLVKQYTLATDVAPGLHTVRIIKLNAAEAGAPILTSINSVSFIGKLGDRPADNKYLVEFVGDSITCGLGSKSKDDGNTYANLTYAYLLCQAKGYDYSFVAVSGIGSVHSVDRHGDLLMGDIYPLTNYYRDASAEYVAERQADLVVIALNTNDNGRISDSEKAIYKANALALIASVKKIHGDDVKIVWYTGMMGTGKCDTWIKEIFTELGGKSAGYYCLGGTKDTAGASSHPSAAGHINNADILGKYIDGYKILE